MDVTALTVPGIEAFAVHDSKTGGPVLVFRSDSDYATSIRYSPFMSASVFQKHAEKIRSLLFNHVKFEGKTYESEDELTEFIDRNIPKYSPEEKIQNVLRFVSSLTTYDGQAIDVNFRLDIEDTQIWRKWYFHNVDEFRFYIENLRSQGLIEYQGTKDTYVGLRLTLEGLTSLIQISENENSRYCFVAMSFDESLKHVYTEAILPALNQTGYLPFILTERHIDSERTINDEIIAGLKAASFTIAEFTQHRQGVYFEAGYALGRGQKVIYVCSKSDFSKAHFDTNHFQHIIWETTEDLKNQLIAKINAFIND